MAIVNEIVVFEKDVKEVWDVMTTLLNYTWRSDIARIEVLDETHFVEYTKDGYATTFTITVNQPYERWEFDLENNNMKGHWIGVFTPMDGRTQVALHEEVNAKKMMMKPLVKAYLKKQQALYIADLKKALE